jgi:autotransporter passenger strand-loop-strand repeat protein
VLSFVTFNAGENPTDYGSKPTRTLTWVVNDTASPNGTSNIVTTTVTITNVNDAPTLSGVAASVTAAPSAAVTLSPSVTITDPDNLTLAHATVAVTAGTFANDGDVLAATTAGTSISASYDSATETLTLTGVDTLAHYRQVLDSVTFDAAGADPTSGGADPTRTVTWVVDDGGASNNLSTPQSTTIGIYTVLNTGQTIFVSAGQTSAGIIVTSGAEIVVLSGGTADNIVVLSSGIEAINFGGAASGTTVSNGGIQYDAGTASATTVSSGGAQIVFGSAAGTTVEGGGNQQVTSGGTASGTAVSSGGIQYDAGTASATTLSGGGTEIVFGSAASTTILSGATQQVVSGGLASATTISSGGIQYDAGTASATTISNSGTQVVFASADGTIIDSGGTQQVVAGGLASNTTISSGGIQYDAGTASGTVLSGGVQAVYGSAANTTVDSGGYELVVSGGSISGATIGTGGTLELGSGASAGSSTIVFAGGALRLDDAVAYNFLVASFGVPDAFDLSTIAFASATKAYVGNTQSGTLTVSDSTHSASIQLLGNYQAASFNLGAEAGGGSGTMVTDPPLVITPPHG